MGVLEEMLLKNGLILRQPDGTVLTVEGSVMGGSLVLRDRSGVVTHRVERAANGVDLVVRNIRTGYVETRLDASSRMW